MAFEGEMNGISTLKERGDLMPDSDFQTFLERLERFQERIGYQFKNKNILIRALTSTSYCSATNNAVPSKGLMDFEGDRLLKKSVTVWIRGYCNDLPPPQKNAIRNFLNSNIYLSHVGMCHMKIDRCVRISKSKLIHQEKPETKIRLTANFVESLIEAVYEDGGKRALITFIDRNVLPPPKKGSLSYLVPFMMSANLSHAQQAFKLFCKGNAELQTQELGFGRYIGAIHFSHHKNTCEVFKTNKSMYRSELAQSMIIRFLKEHPQFLWGFDGDASLLLPTVLSKKSI